jgi:HEAT repeat protein
MIICLACIPSIFIIRHSWSDSIKQQLLTGGPKTFLSAKEQLAKLPSAEKESIISDIIHCLGSKNLKTRNSAWGALNGIGEDAIPLLVKHLYDKNKDISEISSSILSVIGDPSVPFLLKLLDDKNERVRFLAAASLSIIGGFGDSTHPYFKKIVPIMIQYLSRSEYREESENILIRFGPSVVPSLISEIGNPDPGVHHSVVSVLALIGTPEALKATKEALTILIKIVKSSKENPYRRIKSAMVLATMGPSAKDAVPALIEAIQDKSKSALWKGGGHLLRFEALKALGEIGPAAEPAAPKIMNFLEDSECGAIAQSTLAKIRTAKTK